MHKEVGYTLAWGGTGGGGGCKCRYAFECPGTQRKEACSLEGKR